MDIRASHWLGWAAVGGGVLLVISDLLHLPFAFDENFAAVAQEPLHQAGNAVFLVAMVLVVLGLAGIWAVHEQAFGRLGRLGVGLAYVFTVLGAGAAWAFTFVEPTLALEAPALLAEDAPAGPVAVGFMLTFVGLSLSFALLAFAALRAGVVSKVASVIVLLGGLYGLLPFAVAVGIVIGLGFAWWGLDVERVLAGRREQPMAMPAGSPA